MNLEALTPRLRHQLKIVSESGFELRDGLRVLDLGCGEGVAVQSLRAAGFDAMGCDIDLWDTAVARQLIDAGWVRSIPMQPYRIPFDDGQFDLVLSNEVLEHVMSYESFIAENHRVLAPGGLALHIFPGRWTPLEPHTFVPLASVHRSYAWLRFWSSLGVRNQFQRGKAAEEVARLNYDYLRDHTNYPTNDEIRLSFQRVFSQVNFREDLFLRHVQSSKGRTLRSLTAILPFLVPLYRTCWNRVLVVGK